MKFCCTKSIFTDYMVDHMRDIVTAKASLAVDAGSVAWYKCIGGYRR